MRRKQVRQGGRASGRDDSGARLRTLGELHLDAGALRHPKALLLLCYLSLAGPQPRKRLAVLFWPRATDPLNRLSVTLSRIRAAVPDAVAADHQRVWTELTSDVAHLLQMLDAGDDAAAALHGGGFLTDVYVRGLSEELEEWIAGTRDTLARRVQTELLRAASELARSGRFDRAARTAERALDVAGSALLDPDDLGRLHTILVAGDSARAPDVLQEGRGLDLDPSPSRQVARARLPFDGTAPGFPTNLRAPTTPLVGRERERLELARLLALPDRRLLTLVGPGGIGKSRLANAVALDGRSEPRYADGTFFVGLDDATSVDAVPALVATAMELPLGAGDDPLRDLSAGLADRRLLVVLDNLEHLTGMADVVDALLERCPGLTLLATSRDRVGTSAEWLYPVEGLSCPTEGPESAEAPEYDDARSWAAVELFEKRAQRTVPSFRVSPEVWPHVLSICRSTGGSPLALELAAAHVSILSIADIAREIRLDLDFLQATERHGADRHRSLRVVFEHSWRLLHDDDRTCLRRLSVFRGGFTREAARDVAGATLAVLTSLVAQALVVFVADDRYERHPLLHQYTSEKLAALPSELAATRERHAAWALALAQAARPHLNSHEGGRWLDRLDRDHANLEAALAWADEAGEADLLLDLTNALADFWVRRGHHAAALRWHDAVLHHADGVADERSFARSLQRHAFVAMLRGDEDGPPVLLERSLATCRRLGDRTGEAMALSHLGIHRVYQGRFDDAQGFYQEALDVARHARDREAIARLSNNLGDVSMFRGDLTTARRHYQQALRLERSLDDHQMVSNVLGSLATLALEEGQALEARCLLHESLRLVRDLGITFSVPTAIEQTGRLATAEGRPLVAARLWGAAEVARERLRQPIEPFVLPHHQHWVDRACRLAAAPDLEAAWAEGRRLDAVTALDEALALT